MTDEDKAEEYYEDNDYYSSLSEIEDYDEIFGLVEDIVKKSYLDGLKKGRQQKWHDLWKNPNDLPEKMGLGSKEVYVAYTDGGTDFAYYDFDKKKWIRSENEENACTVIAWCELPKFED